MVSSSWVSEALNTGMALDEKEALMVVLGVRP